MVRTRSISNKVEHELGTLSNYISRDQSVSIIARVTTRLQFVEAKSVVEKRSPRRIAEVGPFMRSIRNYRPHEMFH